MKQNEIFKQSEGDRWFHRNRESVIEKQYPECDDIASTIQHLNLRSNSRILEIGCGYPGRLGWLTRAGFSCSGIDPSSEAIAAAEQLGVDGTIGTAENLPYEDDYFDLVIFGFCLYLCDREHLFSIAAEADRVIRTPGRLIIKDFYSKSDHQVPYAHKAGINSHKTDNSKMFLWHPSYTLMTQSVRHHADSSITDDEHEWTALSLLRKKL